MANVRTISSLDDIATVLQDLQITEMDQADAVRFQLDEQASLKDADNINVKTFPGRHGFVLVNPEVLKCKTIAKNALENVFDTMLETSLNRINEDLRGVEASIAALRILVLSPDNEILHRGPSLMERNQAVQHAIYPDPPFPMFPGFEHGTHQQRIAYQHPYATQAERDQASARDKLAQRAFWNAKLRILETRHTILKDMKFEMTTKMSEVFRRIMNERSHLGAGYADAAYPPLA